MVLRRAILKPMCESAIEIAQTRTRQLLQFLREFQRLKKPPVRSIHEYPWHLTLRQVPRHPSIVLGHVVKGGLLEDSGLPNGLVLRAGRPPQTPCPQPPTELKNWLLGGWQKIDENIEFLDSQ